MLKSRKLLFRHGGTLFYIAFIQCTFKWVLHNSKCHVLSEIVLIVYQLVLVSTLSAICRT